MFIAALFIIARTWKQPRCPSADEWIRKPWYIYTMEYYSAIKKNTFESVLMRWVKLEPIIQSEVHQKKKHQYSILTHIYMEFRKMVMITLFAREEKRHRCIEQFFGLCWKRERVGWFGRMALKHVYYHIRNESPVQVQCKIQDVWGWCTGMTQRDGMGREVGGEFRIGNTCMPVVNSCLCMTKPIQYCKVISLQLK